MITLALVLVLSATPPVEDAAVGTREVPVAVYTNDEGPIDDLRAEEIEIEEDGEKRTVLSVERDTRGVDVALILDSSEQMGPEYRASLVPAAMAFWERLPEEARLTIWTCGGRVHHAVDFGVDPETARETLEGQAVGGPVFALDTMMDAARHLRKERARRRVVVIATHAAIQANKTLINDTYRVVARTRVTPMIVLVQDVSGRGQGWDTETIFEQMADGYGGSYELALTPQASHKLLARVAADISSQYRVRYESEARKPGRPDVKVDRKDVRVRVGLSEAAN